jgi:hypothetical protein
MVQAVMPAARAACTRRSSTHLGVYATWGLCQLCLSASKEELSGTWDDAASDDHDALPCLLMPDLLLLPLLLQAPAGSLERSASGAVQELRQSWTSRSTTLVSVLEGAALLQQQPSSGAAAGAAGRMSRSGSLHSSSLPGGPQELRGSGDLGVQVLAGTARASASLAEQQQQGLRQSVGDAGSALGRARLPPLPAAPGWSMRKSSSAAEQPAEHGQLVPAGSGTLRASLAGMLGRAGSGAAAGAGGAGEGDGMEVVASVALAAGGGAGKGGAAGNAVPLGTHGKSVSGGLAAGLGPRDSKVMPLLA